jgi:hypothetical protein
MRNQLMEELKDLVEIPEIGRLLFHKVEELKSLLSKNIHLYSDMEESLLEVRPPKNPGKIHSYGQLFELTKIGKKTWIPSIPYQPEDRDIFAVIPGEIIDFTVKYEVEEGTPVLLPGLTFPGLKQRTFDLSFEKHNPGYITVIIHEHGGIKKIIKIKNHTAAVPPEEKYKKIKQLNRYLIRNDDYFLHVTSEFDCRWKRLIDLKLLNDSSTST